MTLPERAQMIQLLANDIQANVNEFVRACEAKDRHMFRGDTYKFSYTPDGEPFYAQLPLEATQDAIIRKIITLREQLNVLRKELPNAGYLKK